MTSFSDRSSVNFRMQEPGITLPLWKAKKTVTHPQTLLSIIEQRIIRMQRFYHTWKCVKSQLTTLPKVSGLYSFAFVFYTGFIAIITSTRVSVRLHLNINGNPVEDLFASLLW